MPVADGALGNVRNAQQHACEGAHGATHRFAENDAAGLHQFTSDVPDQRIAAVALAMLIRGVILRQSVEYLRCRQELARVFAIELIGVGLRSTSATVRRVLALLVHHSRSSATSLRLAIETRSSVTSHMILSAWKKSTVMARPCGSATGFRKDRAGWR